MKCSSWKCFIGLNSKIHYTHIYRNVKMHSGNKNEPREGWIHTHIPKTKLEKLIFHRKCAPVAYCGCYEGNWGKGVCSERPVGSGLPVCHWNHCPASENNDLQKAGDSRIKKNKDIYLCRTEHLKALMVELLWLKCCSNSLLWWIAGLFWDSHNFKWADLPLSLYWRRGSYS